jgi:hypothetical protein
MPLSPPASPRPPGREPHEGARYGRAEIAQQRPRTAPGIFAPGAHQPGRNRAHPPARRSGTEQSWSRPPRRGEGVVRDDHTRAVKELAAEGGASARWGREAPAADSTNGTTRLPPDAWHGGSARDAHAAGGMASSRTGPVSRALSLPRIPRHARLVTWLPPGIAEGGTLMPEGPVIRVERRTRIWPSPASRLPSADSPARSRSA